MKNNLVRKMIIVLLTLALSMTLLIGCGRNNSAEETAAPAATPAPASPDEPVASPEPVIVSPASTVPPTAETPVLETEPPVLSTEPPAPSAEPTPVQPSSQPQQPAPEKFTGVQGTEFVVPDGFIQLDETPSIGYQYTFWHPDYEIRIVVYEIAPGNIPEGAYETDLSIAKRNPDVTYFNNGENWFVQSGYNNNGEEIFYSKERLTDSGLKTFWITYPTAKREFGDSITTEFEKNFSF